MRPQMDGAGRVPPVRTHFFLGEAVNVLLSRSNTIKSTKSTTSRRSIVTTSIAISAAVEGILDEAVLHRLMEDLGVGPAYTSQLIEFVRDSEKGWRPEIAVKASDSLMRCICIRCLRELIEGGRMRECGRLIEGALPFFHQSQQRPPEPCFPRIDICGILRQKSYNLKALFDVDKPPPPASRRRGGLSAG